MDSPIAEIWSTHLRQPGTLRKRAWLSAGFFGLAAGFAALASTGCGGNAGASTGAGATLKSVTVSMDWPSLRAASTGSRALPESANSIVVTVTDPGGFTDSGTVNRPAVGTTQSQTSTINFFGLAAGTIQISAVAFTGTNGAGQQVDRDDTSTTVGAGSSGSASVKFAGIAFSGIQFTPSIAQSVLQGATVTLTASGVDANGNVITTSPGGKWSSSDPTIATVGQTTGVVTGAGPGTATITFTDSTYGVTGSTTVNVQGGNSTVSIL